MRFILILIVLFLAGCSAPPKPFGGYAESLSPTVYNITMTDNNTEYAQILPSGTRSLTLSARDGTAFYYAFTTGKVAGPTANYLTCPSNTRIQEDGLLTDNVTLYVGCGSAGKIAEVLVWSK